MSGGAQESSPTEQERALSENAAKHYNTYMTTYRPFENKYIEDLQTNNVPRQAIAEGRVNADMAQAGAGTIDSGVNPASGAVFKGFAGNAAPKAKSRATIQADNAVQNQTLEGLQGVVNTAQGKDATTQAGLQSLATDSAKTAINDAYLGVQDTKFNNSAINLGGNVAAAGYNAMNKG